MITNEKMFNENQLDGIKYQLMKAIIRNDSKNYLESELSPEYKRSGSFTKEGLIFRMNTNIKNLTNRGSNPLEDIKKESQQKISVLYNYIKRLDINKLKKLIISIGNETVTEKSQDIQLQTELQSEEIKQVEININSFYRCVALNKAVKGSVTSGHVLGNSIDISAGSKVENKKIFDFIKLSGLEFDQLINEYNYTWLHISLKKTGNRKQILVIK